MPRNRDSTHPPLPPTERINTRLDTWGKGHSPGAGRYPTDRRRNEQSRTHFLRSTMQTDHSKRLQPAEDLVGALQQINSTLRKIAHRLEDTTELLKQGREGISVRSVGGQVKK